MKCLNPAGFNATFFSITLTQWHVYEEIKYKELPTSERPDLLK